MRRRGFIASLAALLPATLIGKKDATAEPRRMAITVRINDPQFSRAVVAAVVEDVQNKGSLSGYIRNA